MRELLRIEMAHHVRDLFAYLLHPQLAAPTTRCYNVRRAGDLVDFDSRFHFIDCYVFRSS